MNRIIVLACVLATGSLLTPQRAYAESFFSFYNSSPDDVDVYVKLSSSLAWSVHLKLRSGERRRIEFSPSELHDIAIQWRRTEDEIYEYRVDDADLDFKSSTKDFAEAFALDVQLVAIHTKRDNAWTTKDERKDRLSCHWMGATWNDALYLTIPQTQCDPEVTHTPSQPIPPAKMSPASATEK